MRFVPFETRACNFFCDCCNHYVCICSTGLLPYRCYDRYAGTWMICEWCAHSNFPKGMIGPYSCSRCFHMQQFHCKNERRQFKQVVIPTICDLFPVELARIIVQYATPIRWYQIDHRVNVNRLISNTVTTSSKKRRMRRRRLLTHYLA